ncbi:unnamed protein product [Calypogeia fissa]
MGSQITQDPDALERERRERRNLSKRKSQQSKEQRDTAYSRLLVEAKEICEKLIQSAHNEAAEIVLDAKSRAASMLESQNNVCAELMVQRDALRQQVIRHEAALERQQRNEPESSQSVQVDLDSAAQFRRADAARKRALYWKLKDISDGTSIAEDSPHDLAVDVFPNRKERSIHYVVSWAAKNVMSKLDHFNDKAKKLFFQKFWKHRSLKQFQPLSLGMNASVGHAVVDLKESLQIVKTAKRTDHLATKRVLLTALVGPSITGNRYQTALARALGIKRHNVHKALKVRMQIDADRSMKYPMGERKVRCDKISEAVRNTVEKYWESNTCISPCVKDKARKRLAKKVHEEHRIHWLEETEVEFFMKFQDWCSKEGNDIDIGFRHRQDAIESLESAVGTTVRMALDEDKTRDVIADYHFYISDDNKHDTLFVQHCMDLHHGWMKAQGINLDQHWVWSDGAASQFKSCRPFYYVSRYCHRFGARMKWFFHASGHGKGVADALGGHIKQGIEREQLKGIDGHLLENAHDVVNFCEQKFALGQEKEYGDVLLVRRMFWEIEVGAVNRTKKWDCDPIQGSRRLHCFDGFSDKLSTLLQEVQDMGVGEGGNNREEGSLGELVQVGEFYAVKAEQPNKWNTSFYIMQCEESVHEVKKDFVDGCDQAFRKGDEVVKGRWFQPQPGRVQLKFVFHDKAPFGYNSPDSIVWIRFGLTPCEVGNGGHRVYTLDVDTLAAITDALDS